MIYGNRKVSKAVDKAQQTAQIVAQVKQLLEKKIIKIEGNVVYLYPQILKTKESALNWMKCVYTYCVLKKYIKDKETLLFENIESKEPIGKMLSAPKLLIEITT